MAIPLTLMRLVTMNLTLASASGLPNMPLGPHRLSSEPNLKVDLVLITPLHSVALLQKLHNHFLQNFKIQSPNLRCISVFHL